MKIALIGTPKSGKTDLAAALAASLREYDPTCGCPGRKVEVVDNYVHRLEGRTGQAINSITGYLGNLAVALERYHEEHLASHGNDHVITCGTLVETAVYLAMHFVSLAVLTDEEKIEAEPRIDAVLRMFAVLYNDTCRYDVAFYLPPPSGDEETRFIDQQIQAGLQGFKLIKVVPLPDSETRLEDALKAVSEVHAA